ncbi:glycosyltransferase family 87 protein [Bacteroidota bacterium]
MQGLGGIRTGGTENSFPTAKERVPSSLERLFLSWAWVSQVLVILVLVVTRAVSGSSGFEALPMAMGVPLLVGVSLLASYFLPVRVVWWIMGFVGFIIWWLLSGNDSWLAGFIFVAACLIAVALVPALAARFPSVLDGSLRKRPVVAVLVGMLCLFGLVRGSLLSDFMVDRDQEWASILPSVKAVVEHQCLPAYLYAGELHNRGIHNVYDSELYPDATAGTEVQTVIVGMETEVKDPFLYPPPFLLLPKLGLLVSKDYGLLRVCVFGINAIALLIVGLLVPAWIGGQRGLLVGLLFPVFWVSLPTLGTLQFGQFQLIAVVLAMGSMLAFSRGYRAAGGCLLAVAILSKVFPAVLLIWLFGRRAWRELGWTAVFGTVFVAISVFAIGIETWKIFIFEQVPRLASGDVAPFFKESQRRIAENISVYGLPFKLEALGMIANADAIASLLNGAFAVILIVLAFFCRPVNSCEQGQSGTGMDGASSSRFSTQSLCTRGLCLC